MPDAGTRLFYDFGEFRLDPQQRLLMLSADGRAIPLAPKAFEMLLFLVESRGELLAKNTLMKALWPNIVVEENSLNQTVSAIRRSLGERPGEHRFIVTEPGRGYRFVADVRVAPAAVKTESPVPPAPSPAVAQATPTASRKSIAVLPFANLTGDSGKDYFGDGMAEELIHTLARIPGLRVPSRTSSFSYKGRSVDVRQIARDLEVGVVLEGSVRSAGERIRVTAQLIDGSNGFHLWSQQYDRDFGDLFKLQDELAHAIVATLRLTLDGEAGDGTLHAPPTRDLEAYHLYLRAMSLLTRLSPYDGIPRVIRMLERVIERDPDFVRAHSAIASLRATAIALDVALPGSLADSEREVKRCLAMDSSVGSSHAALGIIYAAQGRWLDAQERFREALARDAADPSIQQSYGMYLLGTVGMGRAYANASLAAHRLAPALIGPVLNLAVANMLLNQTEAARRSCELAEELGIPRGAPILQDVLAQSAAREGRFEEAAELMVAGLPPDIAAGGGDETVRQHYVALRKSSAFSREIKALDGLRARPAQAQMTQFMKRRLMFWYVQLGALDQAFDVAAELLDYFAGSGSIGTAWAFLWMPEMLPFRRHPRFQLLSQRMNLFDYWQAYGPPDNCELRGGTLICA
jgi:TolB-like protein/Flp pilus assembly protein TadD